MTTAAAAQTTLRTPLLLTLSDAAEYLGISRRLVEKLIESGALHPIDVSSRPNVTRHTYRLQKSDLDAFIRDRRMGPKRAA